MSDDIIVTCQKLEHLLYSRTQHLLSAEDDEDADNHEDVENYEDAEDDDDSVKCVVRMLDMKAMTLYICCLC